MKKDFTLKPGPARVYIIRLTQGRKSSFLRILADGTSLFSLQLVNASRFTSEQAVALAKTMSDKRGISICEVAPQIVRAIPLRYLKVVDKETMAHKLAV